MFHSNTTADDFVTIGGSRRPGANRSNAAVNAARRQGGGVSVEQKYAAGSNKQKAGDRNHKALDEDTETLKHKKVSASMGKLMS